MEDGVKEELLQHLKDLKTLACSDVAMWAGGWSEDDEKWHQQIVALIKKPKVTKEFIKKKIDEMWIKFEIAEVDCEDFVKQIFKEAGYQIGAGVTEGEIEEKAREFNKKITFFFEKRTRYVPIEIRVLTFNYAKDFIRKLYEEAK